MSNATSDHLQSFSKGKKITKISPWFQEGKKKLERKKVENFVKLLPDSSSSSPSPWPHICNRIPLIEKNSLKNKITCHKRRKTM
jgi:hypothetical protein